MKITAGDLKPVPVVYDNAVVADADGRILLPAAKARIHGATPKYEHSGAKDQIGYWNGAADFVSWDIKVTKPGTYAVEIAYSCTAAGSAFTVEVGGQKLSGTPISTGSWAKYRTDQVGQREIRQARQLRTFRQTKVAAEMEVHRPESCHTCPAAEE